MWWKSRKNHKQSIDTGILWWFGFICAKYWKKQANERDLNVMRGHFYKTDFFLWFGYSTGMPQVSIIFTFRWFWWILPSKCKICKYLSKTPSNDVIKIKTTCMLVGYPNTKRSHSQWSSPPLSQFRGDPFSGVAFRHYECNDGQMDMINTPEIIDESCGV